MASSKRPEKFVITTAKSAKFRASHDPVTVQHDYHDHSKEPRLAGDKHDGHDSIPGSKRPGSKKSDPISAPFPNKLYDMLMNAEEDGISKVISFAPHGRAIQIHDTKALIGLLPAYFTLSKIASFQRQLNLYGFSRLTKGTDRGSYYHEYFLRGHPALLDYMHRTKVKGTFVRGRSNPDQEPDFWSMPWVGVDGSQQETSPPAPVLIQSRAAVVKKSAKPRRSPTRRVSVESVVSQEGSDDRDHPSSSLQWVVPVACQSKTNIFYITDESDASEDMEDVVLTSWGMPFHYLPPESGDNLPQQRLRDLDDEKTLAKALEQLLQEDEDSMFRSNSELLQGFEW